MSHSSNTNHEYLIFVIRVINVSFVIEGFVTYEKVLIIMLQIVFVWQNYTTLYFSVSLKFEACSLHHGSVERVHTKYSTLFSSTFLTFFVVFHYKFCAFIIFIYFYDEVSNFRNKILTNQKLVNWWFLTVSETVCTYEENFRTSKILVSFLFFNTANFMRSSLKKRSEKCDQNS